jgi:hypothetical protein
VTAPLPPFAPLIVTAAFDPGSARVFGDLRDRHFPPDRNIVPAHLTLFHHLPGERAAEWIADLRDARPAAGATPFSTSSLRFLGRGVAVDINCPVLTAVRRDLAARWADVLSAQDRQSFRPHVTIQNKVAPAEARALHAELLLSLRPISGTIVGLDLWHYRGGPWEHAAQIAWT